MSETPKPLRQMTPEEMALLFNGGQPLSTSLTFEVLKAPPISDADKALIETRRFQIAGITRMVHPALAERLTPPEEKADE